MRNDGAESASKARGSTIFGQPRSCLRSKLNYTAKDELDYVEIIDYRKYLKTSLALPILWP